MKEILVKNKLSIKDFTTDKNYGVISIEDNWWHRGIPNPDNCKFIHEMVFHDIQTPHKLQRLITTKDALEIIKVIDDNIDNVDIIIFQCNGGISRSAACAAACAVYLKQSDDFIWNSPFYYPNKYVYKTILQTFLDEKDIVIPDDSDEIYIQKLKNLAKQQEL